MSTTNVTSTNISEKVQSNLDEIEQELETSSAYFKPKPGKAYIIPGSTERQNCSRRN
ncbi:MAG: hypothetical protein WA326_12845 [Nitrososphaeraceae archaeon]